MGVAFTSAEMDWPAPAPTVTTADTQHAFANEAHLEPMWATPGLLRYLPRKVSEVERRVSSGRIPIASAWFPRAGGLMRQRDRCRTDKVNVAAIWSSFGNNRGAGTEPEALEVRP